MELPRMTKATADVQAGDILAEAVCDGAGKVLLPAGTTLSEAALAGLRRREIAALVVFDTDPATVKAVGDAMRTRLEYLFRKAGDNLAALTLFNAVLSFRQQQRL